MARRKSDAEDLLDLLLWSFMRTPWWTPLPIAALVFGTITWIVIDFRKFLGPQITGILLIFPFLGAGVVLMLGAIAGAKKKRARLLLDKQRGLDTIRAMSWRDFELLVGEAYRRKGYEVEVTGQGGADGGIDVVLRWQGRKAVVQCKHWRDQQVGVNLVRELYGVMLHEEAERAIFATCGTFTPDAYEFAEGKPIELVDGTELAQIVKEVRAERRPTLDTSEMLSRSSEVQQQSSEPQTPYCPVCGRPMELKTAHKGSNAGSQFLGCPAYPKCRGTRNA